MTRDDYNRYTSAYYAAFPDFHHTFQDIIAEGDRVVVRWIASGTHTKPFMGIPPTGKAVTVTGITIYRIQDGVLMERWVNFDELGMLRQLQVATIPDQLR